jgi:hypothetical protein
MPEKRQSQCHIRGDPKKVETHDVFHRVHCPTKAGHGRWLELCAYSELGHSQTSTQKQNVLTGQKVAEG